VKGIVAEVGEEQESLIKAQEKEMAVEGSDAVIQETIDNSGEEVGSADPKIKKRASRALFQQVTISTETTGERLY